jgi:hypothetical protein
MNDSIFSHAVVWLFSNSSFVNYLAGFTSFIALLIVLLCLYKRWGITLSFDLPINQVIRYAYNTFASADAVLYLWIGASFAAFTLGKILGVVR